MDLRVQRFGGRAKRMMDLRFSKFWGGFDVSGELRKRHWSRWEEGGIGSNDGFMVSMMDAKVMGNKDDLDDTVGKEVVVFVMSTGVMEWDVSEGDKGYNKGFWE